MDRSKYFYIIIEKEVFNIFWRDSKSMGSPLLLTYLEIVRSLTKGKEASGAWPHALCFMLV